MKNHIPRCNQCSTPTRYTMPARLSLSFQWRFCSIIWLILLPTTVYAQGTTNEQVWLEGLFNYAFAKSYNFENIIQYNTLLNSPRWRAFEYNPLVELSLGKHFDVLTGVTFSYTNQIGDVNTFEIRPAIGTQIHFTPDRRVITRLLIRVEQRNIENRDSKTWESVVRPRIRAEVVVPLNRNSVHDDLLWYFMADAEWFLTVDDDVHERFANRFRLRTGIGYRLNYSSRFEFVFMLQESKKAIGDSFYTTDNVFRFRYKHYLRKRNPSKMSGTGN